MLLPPYISCALAGCFVATVVIGFRSGVMPGNSRWPWESNREKNLAMFWLAASIYAVAALFFAGDAVVGFSHGS